MKKWSDFIYKFETDVSTVLFCTKNAGIVTLNKAMYEDILNSLNETIKSTSNPKELAILENMGFIVDDNENEFNDFMKNVIKFREDNTNLGITLLTTTDCNFACKYCFEKGIKDTMYISEIVCDSFITFLKNYIQNNNIKHLTINLFGGEPTLGWKYVVGTLEQVKQICDENAICLSTRIATNGFMFDEHRINDLIPFNLTTVVVTLDGSREFHDKRRYTKKLELTFDVIISNLKKLLQLSNKAKIGVRVNCDNGNIASIPELLKHLFIELGNERVEINLFLKYEINNFNIQEQPANKDTLSEDEYVIQLPHLYDIIKKYGFPTPNYFQFDSLCMAKLMHTMVIHPNGDIYKCVGLTGRESYKFGTIYEQNIVGSHFDKSLYEYCINKKCCFLPICHAGCIVNSLLNYGSVSKVYCKRNLLEKVNKRFILTKLGLNGFETE